MDFRRADPNYVNFVPRTCVDAIDLFNRHRSLGLTADLYPECFVHCARALPGPELDMFHRFIVTPSGDIEKGGEKPTPVDAELEKERKLLLKEAEVRDGFAKLTIEEEFEPMSDYVRNLFSAYRDIRVKVLGDLKEASSKRAAPANKTRKCKHIHVGDNVATRDPRHRQAGGASSMQATLQ